MYAVWKRFWEILWSAFVHLITLNWDALRQDGEDLKAWWAALWYLVGLKVDNLQEWTRGRISYLKGYAFGLFYQLGMEAAGWVANLRVELTAVIDELETWIKGRISYLKGYAFGLFYQLGMDVAKWLGELRTELVGKIKDKYQKVLSLYDWIRDYKGLITNWLVNAKSTINWLKNQAIDELKAFLRNPFKYVVGDAFDPIQAFLNWWEANKADLKPFVRKDLLKVRDLIERGYEFLLNFIEEPEDTIFDILTPVFLDWFEKLLADNWE